MRAGGGLTKTARMEHALSVPRSAPLVVVGVDGSSCSNEALSFAIDEARMRKAGLRIVTAWNVPALAYSSGYSPGVDPGVFEADAKTTSAAALERARGLAADLEIDAITPNAPAAGGLLDAAEGAELLVVGSRGHGGFANLLLGSVGQHLAQHAPCPITIIHARR
jgi:nucleotide-binding universal stress UspA family protein